MTKTQKTHTILAVDDSRTQLMLLEKSLISLDYNVLSAKDGYEALDMIKQHSTSISAVLLDREMPGMNGIEVVSKMKKNPIWRKIPIIMQTGSGNTEQIREGVEAGVFYYLTKPLQEGLLKAVISSAVKEVEQAGLLNEELKKHRASFSLIDQAMFSFRKLEEAEQLSCFLAYCYPDSEQALQGISALLINALEHGNLNLGYKDKTKAIEKNRWREEVEQRQEMPTNKNKHVSVKFSKTANEITLTITDEGQGFDWRSHMEIDPSRATQNHGRGIAIANAACFNKVIYNDKGNQVIATVLRKEELEW